MNERVLSVADELASAILHSSEFIKMRLTEQQSEQDEEWTQLMESYRDLKGQIEDLSCEDQPDFIKIGQLQEQIDAVKEKIDQNPTAIAMRDARLAFMEMMNAVNARLQNVLSPEKQGASPCAQGCAACGGACGKPTGRR